MKVLSTLFILSLAIMTVSCGNKNSSGGSNSSSSVNLNSYSVQTVTGTINFQTSPKIFTASNGSFSIVDQQGAMYNAYNKAQSDGTFVSTQYTYKVTISGIFQSGSSYGSTYYSGSSAQGIVQVSTAVISR